MYVSVLASQQDVQSSWENQSFCKWDQLETNNISATESFCFSHSFPPRVSTEFLVFCFLKTDNWSCQVCHEDIVSLFLSCSGFVRHDELTATSKLYRKFLFPLMFKQKWEHRQLTFLSAGTFRFYRSFGEWHVSLISAALFRFKSQVIFFRLMPNCIWVSQKKHTHKHIFNFLPHYHFTSFVGEHVYLVAVEIIFITVQLFLSCSLLSVFLLFY